MSIKVGYMYTVKKEYFDKAKDPNLMAGVDKHGNDKSTKRPHLFSHTDSSGVSWLVPCTSEYKRIKDSDGTKTLKIQGKEQGLLYRSMYPVRPEYLVEFKVGSRHIGIVKPKDMKAFESHAKSIENRLMDGEVLSKYPPSIHRHHHSMLEEQQYITLHQEYQSLSNTHLNKVLLHQSEGFFIVFGDGAERISEALGFTKEDISIGVSPTDTTPIIRIAESELEAFVKKLNSIGISITIKRENGNIETREGVQTMNEQQNNQIERTGMNENLLNQYKADKENILERASLAIIDHDWLVANGGNYAEGIETIGGDDSLDFSGMSPMFDKDPIAFVENLERIDNYNRLAREVQENEMNPSPLRKAMDGTPIIAKSDEEYKLWQEATQDPQNESMNEQQNNQGERAEKNITAKDYLKSYRNALNEAYKENANLPEAIDGTALDNEGNVINGESASRYWTQSDAEIYPPAVEHLGILPPNWVLDEYVHNGTTGEEQNAFTAIFRLVEEQIGGESPTLHQFLNLSGAEIDTLLEKTQVSEADLLAARNYGAQEGIEVASYENLQMQNEAMFSVYEQESGSLNLFVQDPQSESVNFAHDYKEHPKDIVPAIQAIQDGDNAKTWEGHDTALEEAFTAGTLDDGVLVANNDGVYFGAMQEMAKEAFSLTLDDFVEYENNINAAPEVANFEKLQDLSKKFSGISMAQYYEMPEDLAQEQYGISWEEYYEYSQFMQSPEVENNREQLVMQQFDEEPMSTNLGKQNEQETEKTTSSQVETKLESKPLPLDKSPEIQEVMQLLQENGKGEQVAALTDLINHVKDMEATVKSCNKTISDMKGQIDSRPEVKNHPLTGFLQKSISMHENDTKVIRQICNRIKNELKESCKNIIDALKDKGIEALDKLLPFKELRHYCTKIEAKSKNSIERSEKSIEKINTFANEYHKAGNAIRNIGRMLTGKQTVDAEKEAGKLANALCAPFRNSIELNTNIRDNAATVIEKLDKLSARVDAIHEKRTTREAEKPKAKSWAEVKAENISKSQNQEIKNEQTKQNKRDERS